MSANPANAAALSEFYSAFARRDADAMVRFYSPRIEFSDPVFPELKGEEVAAMWRMLTKRAKDFSLTFRDVVANDVAGSVHWEARYLFSKTGRQVHNVIEASFTFEGGKIVKHVDRFDLWRWAGMALGAPGKLLGWTPMVTRKIRDEARSGLVQFMRENPT
jgi:ketosteroid isomerase-like protein